MNRLTSIFNRAKTPATDANVTSPARGAGTPPPIARTQGAHNLNLPAPVGKREKAKRLIGAAFSVSATSVALEGPNKHRGKVSNAQKSDAHQPAMLVESPPPLADRFKALRTKPSDTGPSTSGRTGDASLDETIARGEHRQYYNLP